MMKRNGRNHEFKLKDASNPREVVLFVLFQVTENQRKSHTLLRETLGRMTELKDADKSFVNRVTMGTLERQLLLDHIIGRYSKTPFLMLKPLIKNLLRMSAYQLLYMDRIPQSAVCNEAVKLAKLHGLTGLSGFVNGVLRNMARDVETGKLKAEQFEEPHLKYSVPKWLYKKLETDFGKEKAEEILSAYLLPREVTVRLNRSKCTEAELLQALEEEGVKARPIDMKALLLSAEGGREALKGGFVKEENLPSMYALSETGDVSALSAFRKGWIQVQDASAALAAAFAAPKAGDYVIDVCAAPGGKTVQLLDMLSGSGFVDARDISEQKIALIRENVERAGFEHLSLKVQDALLEDEESFYRADVIMADLPCSGLGIIGRKPDIKLNLKAYSIEELKDLQREMLTVTRRYVKPHGKLVYATCTLTKEEDEENAAWAEKYLGFRCRAMVKLLPGKDHDGFFIALLERDYL